MIKDTLGRAGSDGLTSWKPERLGRALVMTRISVIRLTSTGQGALRPSVASEWRHPALRPGSGADWVGGLSRLASWGRRLEAGVVFWVPAYLLSDYERTCLRSEVSVALAPVFGDGGLEAAIACEDTAKARDLTWQEAAVLADASAALGALLQE